MGQKERGKWRVCPWVVGIYHPLRSLRRSFCKLWPNKLTKSQRQRSQGQKYKYTNTDKTSRCAPINHNQQSWAHKYKFPRMFCEIWRSIHGKKGTQNANTSPPPSSPLKAYSVCVSLLVVHIASLWNQNLNQDVFQTLGASSVDELPPELRESVQKSNRKWIENRDCIEKNLLARNLVGSFLPLFPALSDSSRLPVHICTGSEYLQRFQNQIFINPQMGWFP